MRRRALLIAIGGGSVSGCLQLHESDDGPPDAEPQPDETTDDDGGSPPTDDDGDDGGEDDEKGATSQVEELELEWWDTEGRTYAVAVSEDSLFVNGSRSNSLGGLRSIDIATGNEEWHNATIIENTASTIRYHEGTLYVGLHRHSDGTPTGILEVDAVTGEAGSEFRIDGDQSIQNILDVSQEYVLAATGRSMQAGSYLYLLNRRSLTEEWYVHFPGEDHGTSPGSGVITDKSVIIGNSNSTREYSVSNGEEVWVSEDSARVVRLVGEQLVSVIRGGVSSRELVGKDRNWTLDSPRRANSLHPEAGVILSVGNAGVSAYDIETGSALWDRPMEEIESGGGVFDPGRPSVVNDSVLVPASGGLVGLDIESGEQQLYTDLPTAEGHTRVTASGIVTVADTHFYGTAGTPLWNRR
ncbi:PQQ-binding-like beta-propeller repeat protein [Natronoglomus mannanivorans]|uniref:PQQ-binding-like beta-propeller repeat protein n=1 Tax=Natronoglomus mannanivorans TaxID=2979990 RepID=A0AAP2Z1S9_9EURY|nr:PQQ-binding-like beta-propeller repeat protein [Halobacteria archaeon AArc-xg1-1]